MLISQNIWGLYFLFIISTRPDHDWYDTKDLIPPASDKAVPLIKPKFHPITSKERATTRRNTESPGLSGYKIK